MIDDHDDDQYLSDQTAFSNQAPLFEKNQKPVVAPESELVTPPPPKRKVLILVIGGLSGILVLFLGIVFWLSQQSSVPQDQRLASPSPSIAPVTDTQFQARLNEVKNDLNMADPTRRDLAFPPVDMEIQLTE